MAKNLHESDSLKQATRPLMTGWPALQVFAEGGLRKEARPEACARQISVFLYPAQELSTAFAVKPRMSMPGAETERPLLNVFRDVIPKSWSKQHRGVVDELPFWTEQDPLPGGLPRCDYHYRAIDSDGDSGWARCASPATKRVRVTENNQKGLETYEAKGCTRCAARRLTDNTEIDLLGDLEIPPAGW